MKVSKEKEENVQEGLFRCSSGGCNRVFKTKFALKRHFLVHSNEKSYKCNFCGKQFGLPQYLKEHTNTHTRERPYICGVNGCQEKFRQAGKLSLHRRTHPEFITKHYKYTLNPKQKRLNAKETQGKQKEKQVPGNEEKMSVEIKKVDALDLRRELYLAKKIKIESEQAVRSNSAIELKPLPLLSVAMESQKFKEATTPSILSCPSSSSKPNYCSLLDSLPALELPYSVNLRPILPAPNPIIQYRPGSVETSNEHFIHPSAFFGSPRGLFIKNSQRY